MRNKVPIDDPVMALTQPADYNAITHVSCMAVILPIYYTSSNICLLFEQLAE